MAQGMRVTDLNAWFGTFHAVKCVNIEIPARSVTAVIGPSGCGKSTFIRCLNRLHELRPGAKADGQVFLGDVDIYARKIDPVALRRRIGMVFQQPNPFPTLSIKDNVAAGLRLNGIRNRKMIEAIVEESLYGAGLWDEVKDRLRSSAMELSGGQQQRLCIARALALRPEVLLLDEPASALDPASTARIEDLIQELKKAYTVVIVTHNMQQATRVSDFTAFFLNGELIEHEKTDTLFTTPRDARTESYITGRFG